VNPHDIGPVTETTRFWIFHLPANVGSDVVGPRQLHWLGVGEAPTRINRFADGSRVTLTGLSSRRAYRLLKVQRAQPQSRTAFHSIGVVIFRPEHNGILLLKMPILIDKL